DHPDARRSAHGLFADRSLQHRSAGGARAAEADASAEPGASRRHGLGARACDGDHRSTASASELRADRRELVSRLAGHGGRSTVSVAAWRLHLYYGRRARGREGRAAHVPLRAVRAGQGDHPRIAGRFAPRPVGNSGAPSAPRAPDSGEWVNEPWSSFPRTTKWGTSHTSCPRCWPRTRVSKSSSSTTTPPTAPGGSPKPWRPKRHASTSSIGR